MTDTWPKDAPPRLPAPAPRRQGFALTPLADVMFQLLLFFMLTSSLAPYALLPLGAAAPATGDSVRDLPVASDSPAPPAESQIIWHLEHGEIRSGSARIPLGDLPRVLEDLGNSQVRDLVVFVTRSAQASDLAALLEQVQRSELVRVQLVGG